MAKLALVAFSLVLATLSAPSWAQQGSGSSSERAAGANKQSTAQPGPAAARKPAKPATTTQRAPALPEDTMRLPQSNAWTINDALPKESRAVRAPVPELTPLSRVPLDAGGSVGFDSFSAAKPAPGQEVYSQRDTGYAGMSLSVPSLNKALPIPLLPPIGRPE